MSDKIMTLHPDPEKQGVNVDKVKYTQIKEAIITSIKERGEMPLKDLYGAVENLLPDFEGSVGWYLITIKLDLEARKLIEQVPGKTIQHLRLVEKTQRKQ